MANGKPIIASAKGETARIINEAKCGISVTPNDYKALSKAIVEMVKERSKWKEFGENAQRYYVKNFSKEIFMKKLENELKLITESM